MKPTQANTQDNTRAASQVAADHLSETPPVLVEEVSIDELAVREEYAACYTQRS